MKHLFLTTLLLMAGIGMASAQQQGDNFAENAVKKDYKEPRVRFGVSYRHSLALREQYKVKIGDNKVSQWGNPDEFRGGELLLEGTVRINRNWNTGLGVGFAGYNKAWKTFKVYAKGERLYGLRPSRWFNYADLGATLYPDNSTGLTAELGGGYRIAITRRTRLDCTLGFEYLNLVGTGYFTESGTDVVIEDPRGARFNRFGFTVGVAMHF